MLNTTHSQNANILSSTRNRSNANSASNKQGQGLAVPIQTNLGQENRRPLLHRVFGGTKTSTSQGSKPTMGSTQLSNSVGAVTRPSQNSYLQPSGDDRSGSMPNAKVLAASSRMQQPQVPQQSYSSTGQMLYEQQNLSSQVVKTATQKVTHAVNERVPSSSSVTNRSGSRVRQFGKELTSMFSMSRQQQSRQSSQGSAGQPVGKPTIIGRHHTKSSINQTAARDFVASNPSSAKHADHVRAQGPVFDYQSQKSSQAANQPVTKTSLTSIEFQKNKSSSRRDIQIKSREKLPEIHNKAYSIIQTTKPSVIQRPAVVLRAISKIDQQTLADIYHVSEYCAEIERHMQKTELECQPDPHYIKRQQSYAGKRDSAISENMRATLVDWIVQVHMKFRLLPETLFIAVNLIDRFLSVRMGIQKDQIQLLGVAALLIATKYEEIYPPTVKEFVYITKKAYTHEQIVEMERQVIFTLQFNITETSPYRFLERYSKIAQSDQMIFFLAQYMLELALLDSRMSQYAPSLQASAALYVAMRITLTDSLVRMGKDPSAAKVSCWSQALQEHTHYSRQDLKECARDYFHLASLIQKSELTANINKFSQKKYLEVANFMASVMASQSSSDQRKAKQEQKRAANHTSKSSDKQQSVRDRFSAQSRPVPQTPSNYQVEQQTGQDSSINSSKNNNSSL